MKKMKKMDIRANTVNLSKKTSIRGARYELYVGNKVKALPSFFLGFFQMRPQDPKFFLDETLRSGSLKKRRFHGEGKKLVRICVSPAQSYK